MHPVHPGVIPQLGQITAQMNQLQLSPHAASVPVNIIDTSLEISHLSSSQLPSGANATPQLGQVSSEHQSTSLQAASYASVEAAALYECEKANTAELSHVLEKAPYAVVDHYSGTVLPCPPPESSAPFLECSNPACLGPIPMASPVSYNVVGDPAVHPNPFVCNMSYYSMHQVAYNGSGSLIMHPSSVQSASYTS